MEKIDFVIIWVDGSDPEWLAQKNEYNPNRDTDSAQYRYRDMGILKYWFRAVEAYAPWVNKIHFVTWGHLPDWLNVNNPKLNIVKHTDYIPEKYLPTFSSHPIELNLHRIDGLAEKFVYFNDDMYLNNSITPEFYFKNGLPCDFAYVNNTYCGDTTDVWTHVVVNDIWTTNNNYSYIKSFLKHPSKYVCLRYALKNVVQNIIKLENKDVYPGMEIHHMPQPFLKSTLEDAWENIYDILDKTCCHRFRSPFDVSQSVFRYRQIAQGKFYPVSKKTRGKLFNVGKNISNLSDAIISGKHRAICINDTPNDVDFDLASKEISAAYERKLPNKSGFEI